MIVVDHALQTSGVEYLETPAGKIDVMRDWEVRDR
jgi:hypothetical protein